MTSATDALPERGRTAADSARRARSRVRWVRFLLMVLVPVLAVAGGGWWYLAAERYVSTDDAYIQAATVAVSSDVAGRLVEVAVRDNQSVKAGDLLFRLDDRPYRIAVERAQAQLAGARLQIESLRATYRQKLVEMKAAEDTQAYQQREADRQQSLVASHIVSQAAYDQARHNLDAARQAVGSARQQIANILASLGGNPDIETDQHPLVQQAQAQLDQARLDLSHTTVSAAINGIVTKVDKFPIGTYLNAATPAFALVGTDEVWVEVNFKETDLTHMRVGQEAVIDVDAYPDRSFKARVASLSPGTGSEFSVLPPQNATGNWVKVVQRLPVRLVVEDPDPNRPLRAGMSVDAEVDTRYQSPLLARINHFLGRGDGVR